MPVTESPAAKRTQRIDSKIPFYFNSCCFMSSGHARVIPS